MDRFEIIRAMSMRRLAGWALGLLTVAAMAVLAAVAWRLKDGGGAVDFLWTWGSGVAVLVLVFAAIWAQLDHLLHVREFDKSALPARPELYDFDQLNPPMHLEELGGKKLKDLTFVVFDTETTGLKPSEGDEIISIAGVRVTGGRIEEDAPFSRLVHPGKKIPKASIRFHGITDDMVTGEPPIGDVLPAFKVFVGEAVLVAHNAAFDVRFLKLKEDATGVVFDNMVLDSLLLSVFLDAESRNHSLDAIAERMGVEIEGRHTALGDSIVTAKVFLRMLDMLEARGITTLRQAVDASIKMEHVREMQKQF
ncbi:MAG: exonuclease domain-containing protein [Alphaproteobacteria bacterium]